MCSSKLDIPWFRGIFNAFSFCLVCLQKPFCIYYYVSFSLFAQNLFKDERGSFRARNAKMLPSTELVMVRCACDGP